MTAEPEGGDHHDADRDATGREPGEPRPDQGAESHADESFENGLLEYPQYTRPQVFEGREIPAVLTSGDHAKVEKWRRAESEALTRARRPDLLK